jgi:hypothetical protein
VNWESRKGKEARESIESEIRYVENGMAGRQAGRQASTQ